MTDNEMLAPLMRAVQAYAEMCAKWYDRKPAMTTDTPITDLQDTHAAVIETARLLVAWQRADALADYLVPGDPKAERDAARAAYEASA